MLESWVRTRGGIVGLVLCFQDTWDLSLGGKIMTPKQAPDAGAPPAAGAPPTAGAPPAAGAPPVAEAPPAAGAPPVAEAPPAAEDSKKPPEITQTPEELAFYAPNYIYLTILAVITFPPLGLLAVFFSYKTMQANKNSQWEDAYINSGRTGWLDVFSILIGLAIIYVYALFM
ncbi:transmembrane protein PMIS2 [Lycaon pictus]